MKRLIQLCCLIPLVLMLASCDSGGGGDDNSGPRTVVVFGDSITSDYNYPGTPPWPELIQSQRPEWTVVNRATGSERIAGVRRKASGSITEDTDAVVILVGSVNVLFFDLDSYAADLSSVIQLGQSRGAKVLVCTVPPMVGGRIGYASTVNRLNRIIRDTTSANGATLVDLFSELNGSPERFPDGLHPDLDGQRIIAVAVRERI